MNVTKQTIGHLTSLIFSSTAKNTYYIFLGNLSSMVFAFIFTVLLARILSFSDLGYFSALLSLLLLTSDVADIGIGSSLSRFLPPMSHDKEQSLIFYKSAFILQLTVATVVSGLIFIFSLYINSLLFHSYNLTLLVQVISIGVFCSIMSNFFLYTLMARQKFIRASFYTAIGGLLRVLILLLLIMLSTYNLHRIVLAQVMSLTILAGFGIYMVGTSFFSKKIRIKDLIRLISFAVYLGIARGLTAIAGKLDVLMLISLTNSTEAGIYSIASRVISLYPVLTGSFSTVIAPKIASVEYISEIKNFLFKVILATLGLICTIFVLIITAYPFMSILFGMDKGVPAVSVFQLLLVSMIFFVGSLPAVSLAIYYLKKPFILTVNSVIQLMLVVGGNLIFIPKFGRFGAAYSLILAYSITLLTTTVLTFIYIKKKNA